MVGLIFPIAPGQTIAQMWSNGARGGHFFADNISIYKADTVILGCRSPQGKNLLRGAYRKNKVKNKK